MKKIIILVLLSSFSMSCNEKVKESNAASTVQNSDATAQYACPMDPEIKGAKGDKCSKCGMDLEEVKM